MTRTTSAPDCFLYYSHLASDADLTCIAAIVKTARQFNKTESITGMLVFDGQRFCQYIEGPRGPLTALIDRIAQDPRHTNFTPQHYASVEGERLFSNWSMAYVVVDDDEPLDALSQLRGMQAVQQLTRLMPLLDAA